MYKKSVMHVRAKLLFCLLNLLFLSPSRCRTRRWILKSLISQNHLQFLFGEERCVTKKKTLCNTLQVPCRFRENFAAKKNLETTRSSKIIMMIIKKKNPS